MGAKVGFRPLREEVTTNVEMGKGSCEDPRRTVTLAFLSTDTVPELKRKLQRLTGIAANTQFLTTPRRGWIAEGQTLDDGLSAWDYAIRTGEFDIGLRLEVFPSAVEERISVNFMAKTGVVSVKVGKEGLVSTLTMPICNRLGIQPRRMSFNFKGAPLDMDK